MRSITNQCPTHIESGLWEEMSADARYQAHKDLHRTSKRRSLGKFLEWGLLVPPLLFMALPPVQHLVTGLIAPAHAVDFVGQADPLQYLDTSEPTIGKMVAGFEVTSGYGVRVHPVTGELHTHRGVDLATPPGTPLYAPVIASTIHKTDTVKVHCWEDAAGGGTVAEISSESIPQYRFKALHLSQCIEGNYKAGAVFARTGDTGIGTAAHLDFRQLSVDSDQTMPPMTGYIDWVLTGKPGAPSVDVVALKAAIISQESGGDPTEVNHQSGALGLGQVMPENLAEIDKNGNPLPSTGWDYEALGRDVTPEEFLASADIQNQIIDHKLSQIALSQSKDANGKQRTPIEIAKRTAAVWYSGKPDYCSSTETEYFGEGTYPSGYEYCQAVAEKFDSNLQR